MMSDASVFEPVQTSLRVNLEHLRQLQGASSKIEILKVLRRLLCLEKIKYLFRSENLETREHLLSFTSVPSELFAVSARFLAHIITLLQLFIFQLLQDASPPRQP